MPYYAHFKTSVAPCHYSMQCYFHGYHSLNNEVKICSQCDIYYYTKQYLVVFINYCYNNFACSKNILTELQCSSVSIFLLQASVVTIFVRLFD